MDHIILRVLRMKWGRDKTCNLKGFKLRATFAQDNIKGLSSRQNVGLYAFGSVDVVAKVIFSKFHEELSMSA